MTSHQLAKQLLDLPDVPVISVDDSDERPCVYEEVTGAIYPTDARYCTPEQKVVNSGEAIIIA